ncbi:MAG: DUF479 domain-containing protein [Cyclobacteriaceae bacterium]|nr:DUF479 domain-containing protein [Cyclobacteriaceae bacterium]
MNFLGHFYLSPPDPDVIAGNFIADFVKGKKFQEYPDGVSKGILFHREIDHYTDKHPAFTASRRRLFSKYRHFAGVLTDMFYDHLLAIHWEQLHEQALPDFADAMYIILNDYQHIMPEGSKLTYYYMKKNNWLVNYAHTEGLNRSLRGIASRFSFHTNIDHATEHLAEDYAAFEGDFFRFIYEARQHTKAFLQAENPAINPGKG